MECLAIGLLFNTGLAISIVSAAQIDKKLMQASNMIERVRKEVEIHSRLKHPAILEVCCTTPNHHPHEGHFRHAPMHNHFLVW